MSKTFKIMTISFLFFCGISQNCEAYDNDNTHKYLNLRALEESKADSILKDSLGISEGINKKVGGKEIWKCIRDGGREEDEPNWRCLRHFHDPLKDWNDAGLSSSYRSSIYWAQTPEAGNSYGLYNVYSWRLANDYYYQALTTGSEEYYAITFRALGQLMHLVSDAAVPAHVRNDPHPFVQPYEKRFMVAPQHTYRFH
jgi:hypothetical protein